MTGINIFQADKTDIVLAHVTSIKEYGTRPASSAYEVRLTNGDGVLVSKEQREAILELLSPVQSSVTVSVSSTEAAGKQQQ
jgi:hypothetical protein